jgi:hypothetical protein
MKAGSQYGLLDIISVGHCFVRGGSVWGCSGWSRIWAGLSPVISISLINHHSPDSLHIQSVLKVPGRRRTLLFGKIRNILKREKFLISCVYNFKSWNFYLGRAVTVELSRSETTRWATWIPWGHEALLSPRTIFALLAHSLPQRHFHVCALAYGAVFTCVSTRGHRLNTCCNEWANLCDVSYTYVVCEIAMVTL